MRILVPQPGVKPVSPAVKAKILNHWATREVPEVSFLYTHTHTHTLTLFTSPNQPWWLCHLGFDNSLSWASQEAWVQSLGWEDPLEEGMANEASILAWRTAMDRGAWRATIVYGVAKSQTRLRRLNHARMQVMGVSVLFKKLNSLSTHCIPVASSSGGSWNCRQK